MAIHAFLDFDGTISQMDVGDEIIRAFGSFEPLHSELLEGKMTVAQYYTRAVESFTPAATPEALTIYSIEQELDPGIGPLLRWLNATSIPTYIVSDGFDVYIRPLLSMIDGASQIPVYCNKLDWNGMAFTPLFPGASESCSCFCASCKRNAIISNIALEDTVVYVGDGRSDTCAVQYADIVFAKGTLAAFCTAEGIPFHHYRSLTDVLLILQRRHQERDFRPRRQAFLARKRAVEAE
ncbi:MAG: HAD-IB family phosphatase [Ignavibacteria bacterium]|jgi:2-hydroxy-3-keto-5-methylthiopentenyl-1-phosphate phosphatase